MFHVKQKRVAFWCPAGACLFCRRLTLPLVCFSAPIPPGPLPPWGRGDFCFILPGAGAPGTPAAKPGRHWLFLPYQCFPVPIPPCPPSRREGGILGFLMQGAPPLASPALSRPRHLQSLLLQCPAGGVSGWSPAALAFGLLFCPHPPTPFPRGEGGDFWFSYARGFAPCIPEVEPARHWLFSAASVLFLPPSPPTPFPAGRGRFLFYFAGG